MNRGDVTPAQVHIESSIAQYPNLLLFARLRLYQLSNTGKIFIQDDHLRGATCRTTRFNRARRCVSASHERNGARCGAARRAQKFFRRADAREIKARTRTALEDHSLFAIPVQNRVHRVIHVQDEARRYLLRRTSSDVERHGRTTRKDLMKQHVGQLMLKYFSLLIGVEISVFFTGLGVCQYHAVDELLE